MNRDRKSSDSLLDTFDRQRPLLSSIAYRMLGADKIARFFSGILRKPPPGFIARQARVNGRPDLVGYFGGGRPLSVTTFDVTEGRIRTVRLVVNPEKLGSVSSLERLEKKEAPE